MSSLSVFEVSVRRRSVFQSSRRTVCSAAAMAGLLLSAATVSAQTPDEASAAAILTALFQEQGLTPKDLVAQTQVAKSLEVMFRAGWQLPKSIDAAKLVLPDGDFLIRQSRSPAGRAFFRRLATMDHGYDRVDRIRGMPMGEQRIVELIRGPDGYKMIDYLADTSWGKNMGRQLSRAQGGADFNKATGRIYSVEDFVSAAAKGAVRPKPNQR